MRKTIILISGIVLATCLVSCGSIQNTNEESKKVTESNSIDKVSEKIIEDINAIGEVSLEDEELINNTLKIYETLTDNQKEQVENYIDLLNAKDSLEQYKKEQELEQVSKKEVYLSKEREYYTVIEKAIDSLKSECKYPETLEIKEVIYDSFTSGSVYISYSAENDLGNSPSGYYAYGVGTGVGIDGADYYDSVRKVATGNNSKFPYEIGDKFYSQDEEIGIDTRFIFIVDLEDFENR